MDLEPTRTEARVFVTCLCAFWATGATFGEDPASAVVVVAALPCVFAAFAVLARVLSRATGIEVSAFLGTRWPRRGSWRAGALLLATLLTPRWWNAVVRATGWPAPLVVVALVVTLAATIVGPLVRT